MILKEYGPEYEEGRVLGEDPDYLAFMDMVRAETFALFPAGTWVAVQGGKLLGHAGTYGEICIICTTQGVPETDFYVDQVNVRIR